MTNTLAYCRTELIRATKRFLFSSPEFGSYLSLGYHFVELMKHSLLPLLYINFNYMRQTVQLILHKIRSHRRKDRKHLVCCQFFYVQLLFVPSFYINSLRTIFQFKEQKNNFIEFYPVTIQLDYTYSLSKNILYPHLILQPHFKRLRFTSSLLTRPLGISSPKPCSLAF